MSENLDEKLQAGLAKSEQLAKDHELAEQKRKAEELILKEQQEWQSGDAIESVKKFEEFLKKGYTPTYESCGGPHTSQQKPEIMKLACKYGLSPEDATKLFVQTKDSKVMEILVKEGKADVCKYPMTKIQEWQDKPDTVTEIPGPIKKKPIKVTEQKRRPVYKRVPNPDYWDKGLTRIRENDGRGWEKVEPFIEVSDGYETYYEDKIVGYDEIQLEGKRVVTKNNEGALPAFRKLVELGYKPENYEDAKAFDYMAEKLKPIIEAEKRKAQLEAERKAEEQRRDAEIAKIGDEYPLGQKLLASALIKVGIMKDSSQVDSIYSSLTNDQQKQEFERLQKEGIMSEKFEVLKPWEFINSKFFTDTATLECAFISDMQKIPAIKSFRDEAKEQHDFELKFVEAQKAVERAAEEVKKEADEKFEKTIQEAKKSASQKIRRIQKSLQESNQKTSNKSSTKNKGNKRRIDGMKAFILGTAATVAVGAVAVTASNSKKDNKDPEESKNKKEVVIPADKKNVIEVEGDITDAQAVALVNKYKKEQAAKNGNSDKNQKGQTYYIVVKNSKHESR